MTYGTNGEPLDGAAVCLTFTDAPASRASLNSTAAAETWEKSLTSLTVYVFNSQGNLVAQRSFTSEELADKSATFALPHSAAGTTCDFYAVANLSLTGVTTKIGLALEGRKPPLRTITAPSRRSRPRPSVRAAS